MTKLPNTSDFNYLLDIAFNKYNTSDGTIIYWRECCIPDCRPDEQGYLWVYEDGNVLHSYRRPDFIGL